MQIKTVIFICGLGGDAGMTYVPSLREFCESKGYVFYTPHMPSFEEGITYAKYKKSFENLIKSENIANFENVLLIGQSAGTNFVVKYLAEKPMKIGGYISCAGFRFPPDKVSLDKFSSLKSFYPTNKQYEIFKNLPFKKYSIFGGKDCFFTTENLSKYADDIGSEKIFDKNGLHGTISEDVKVHKLLHKVIEEKF